jgi:hypothetical protein
MKLYSLGMGIKATLLEGLRISFDDVTSLIKYLSIPQSYSFFTTVEAATGEESTQGTPRIKVRNFK